MASFFSRAKEAIRNVTTPLDELDRHFIDMVERATSEVLIGPDWALNLELVDQINNNPRVCSDKVCRAMRKTLISPNTKVQLLTLTLLETVVKNVDARFHGFLADSELFAEMQQMADPPPHRKVNVEVKDRILTLLEKLGKAVTHVPAFRDAYEAMLDRGVDFPVQNEDDLPFTVRSPAPRITEPRAGGLASDALADVSEEDRRAIQQAMLELDQEAHAHTHVQQELPPGAGALPPPSVQHAAYAPPTVVPPPAAGMQPGSTYPHGIYTQLPPMYGEPAPVHPMYSQPAPVQGVYGQPAATGPAEDTPPAAPNTPQQPLPMDPQEAKTLLEVAKNSRELLTEMLLSLPADDMNAVREPYITELAGQVKRMKSQLESAIHSATDEAILSSAISEHEEVQRVIQQYNDALARANATQHGPESEGVPAVVQPGHLFSGAPIYPGAQFSISDDEVDGTLQTRRGGVAVVPTIPPPPAAGTVVQPQANNLITLDSPTKAGTETTGTPHDDGMPIAAPAAAAVATVAVAAPVAHAESNNDDALVQQLDQLVLEANKGD